MRSAPTARTAARRAPAARTGPTTATRGRVLERDGFRCVRCGVSIEGRPHNVHHRDPRGMGGTSDPAANSPANLITVCGSATTGCHGWIEGNRAAAAELGFLVLMGERADGKPLPVHGVGLRLLTAGGEYAVAALG